MTRNQKVLQKLKEILAPYAEGPKSYRYITGGKYLAVPLAGVEHYKSWKKISVADKQAMAYAMGMTLDEFITMMEAIDADTPE